MRILVVDDSDEGRDVAEAMLLAAGYEDVITAASATEAFKLLAVSESQSHEPAPVDLVLLDIVMPEIDGIEACARIRNDPCHADVPIIMVTMLGDIDSLANAFVAGATDYITKPLNRVELLARVRCALKLKSELDRRLARERELLEFISAWGEGRASHWIDEATGLLVAEVAEAYLSAASSFPSKSDSTVIALTVDRLDAYRRSQGEAMVTGIMGQVAHAVRATVASVGVIAAAYRSGVIVLIVPELRERAASALGEALRASVARLAIHNAESIVADHVTASVAVVTGRVDGWIDRAHLLTRAVLAVPGVSAAGGNRVVAVSA